MAQTTSSDSTQILSYIQCYALIIHHTAGTCATGSANSTTAVGDFEDRVLGSVSNLRIVDACTFPSLPPPLWSYDSISGLHCGLLSL